MADRLTLVRALEDSGMASPAADRIAAEIYDAIHENVATKTDIAAVRTDIEVLRSATKTDIAAVRTDIETLRVTLRSEIDTLRFATKSDLRAAITEAELRLTLRGGAIAITVSGVLFAALHYWPAQ